jgi:hypothetical protein
LALEIVENLFRANDTVIGPGALPENPARRLDFQHRASTAAKLPTHLGLAG